MTIKSKTESEAAHVLAELLAGLAQGKRWVIVRFRGGFVVLRRPSHRARGFLRGFLPPDFPFHRENRALLITHARQMRMAVAEHLHGPSGHA